ncbi:hypothetical protein EV174_004260 [Coemansia sp. RSA 2320]|nr:hypothetical protein EV174_004260 [Coemansia sp. RSA 2320]
MVKPELSESILDEALLPIVQPPDIEESGRRLRPRNLVPRLIRNHAHIVALVALLLLTGCVLVWSAEPSPPMHSANDAVANETTVHLRPYKDTAVHMLVFPNHAQAEYTQLGFSHIYVVHTVGHPDRLVRMTQLLQLLRITAEFVPVLDEGAEWQTRFQIYADIRQRGYRSALILDDSVDMELNIRMIMKAVHQHMPPSWDMFFPGHCGAFEGTQASVSSKLPALRVANMPICLHAHAVSFKGAARIVKHLRPSSEIMAMAIMRLKERGLLHMYSLDTPVFTPRLGTDEAKKQDRPAGNKRLAVSAINHLAVWQGSSTK